MGGLVRLLLPNFFGGSKYAQWSIAKFPHEEAAYIGLLPAFLALLAPLLIQRSKIKDRRSEFDVHVSQSVPGFCSITMVLA
jgi:hypothetical protein